MKLRARASQSLARRPASRPASKPAAARNTLRVNRAQALGYAREVLQAEARSIEGLVARLDASFYQAVELCLHCEGQVVVTGMGKPGFIAQKLSATLASTGTPSIYLHPAEAAHGDLGRVSRRDVVLALSNSGATEELLRILPSLKRLGAKVIALTGDPSSKLARAADVVLDIGRIDEACPLGLVPTASTAALLALGDALTMTLSRLREFSSEEYALFHPGGKIGRQVMRVSDVMRQGDANPVVRDTAPLHEVVVTMTNTRGRPGAANVVDRHGKLVGIFTDGDLRRMVEKGRTDFSSPVRDVMGKRPRCVLPDELVLSAAAKMRAYAVDQLPVLDEEGRSVGLLDVQDLLAARVV